MRIVEGSSTWLKNPRQSSLVANVALAYCFYLPLIASGFAFGLGLKNEFITAGTTFLLFFGIASILGVIVLFLYKIRPAGFKNSLIFIVFIAIILVGLVIYYQSTQGNPIFKTTTNNSNLVTSTSKPTNTITLNSSPQETTTFFASVTPTKVNTVAIKVEASETLVADPINTATITLTPLPEIIWAEIQSPEGNGANIREGPGFSSSIVKTVLNGTAVQVLEEVEVVDGVTWIHIRFIDGVDGWIVRNLIVSATPEPEW